MKRSVFRWFQDVSIARKLYFTVGLMALLIVIELGTLVFSINTLSSVRAYVGGEGLWSKGQKDAMYQLSKYGRTHAEADYDKFLTFLKVGIGDRKTRLELEKPNPDMDIARQGFIEGRNHPDDIDGMIQLLRRFNSNRYISRAIHAWSSADSFAIQLNTLATAIHNEINSPVYAPQRLDSLLAQLDPINEHITYWEDEFSYSLGEGSRWLENWVLRILFIMALSVECIGLTLAFTVSRGIQKGLDEILQSAQAVAKGDFSRKAQAFSADEIGTLANDFNMMADELDRLENENREAHNSLEKKVQQRTVEIERKNKELEQFAYVASHDLQEPLRTVSGFAEMLQQQYKGRIDETADKFLHYIMLSSERMKTLIKDLLDYSRIGREKETRSVDCNKLLQDVLADMAKTIGESGAKIKVGELPTLRAYQTELKLLFQNLISNSIKFHSPGQVPEVEIGASRLNNQYQFYVRDNGIGIDPQSQERIFIIFQRLHTRTQYEGSGIGLAHVKKIAELHGGQIRVESSPGQGATFYFTISTEL